MHVHGTSALREQIDAVKYLVQWHTYYLWRIPSWRNELQLVLDWLAGAVGRRGRRARNGRIAPGRG